MNLPYPMDRGDMPLERYLLNLLAAIVKQSGGEVRLTSRAIIESGTLSLSKTPSDKMDGVVLRTSPAGAELYFALEAPPSTTESKPRRQKPVSVQEQPPEDAPVIHRQLSDLDLYLLEQEKAARRAEAQAKATEPLPPSPGVYPWQTRQ